MASVKSINFEVTKYRILFIPFASLTVLDDVCVFSVMGFRVYKRLGKLKSLMGFTWGSIDK